MYQEWFKEYERIKKGIVEKRRNRKEVKEEIRNKEWKKFKYYILFKNNSEAKGTIEGPLKDVIDSFMNGNINLKENGKQITYYNEEEIVVFELTEINE